jgi:hypothetical protein
MSSDISLVIGLGATVGTLVLIVGGLVAAVFAAGFSRSG